MLVGASGQCFLPQALTAHRRGYLLEVMLAVRASVCAWIGRPAGWKWRESRGKLGWGPADLSYVPLERVEILSDRPCEVTFVASHGVLRSSIEGPQVVIGRSLQLAPTPTDWVRLHSCRLPCSGAELVKERESMR
jgi:hypothetical protein